MKSTHEITIAAESSDIFDLIARVDRWPAIFEPTIGVEVLHREQTGGTLHEDLQLVATVDTAVRTWRSHREIFTRSGKVSFEQIHAAAPFARMSGGWHVSPNDRGCTVHLEHDIDLQPHTSPEQQTWAREAVHANSTRELQVLKRLGELARPVKDLLVDVVDHVDVDDVEEAMSWVWDAERWTGTVPHVRHVNVDSPSIDTQRIEMTTISSPDKTQTTTSTRFRTPNVIHYKQHQTLPTLLSHAGSWSFARDALEGPAGAVTVRHLALLDPAISEGLDDLRETLGQAFLANSRSLLEKRPR